MATLDDLKNIAGSNVGIGTLGGASLGLLLQALRPKDKDQSAWKEYIMSAILGAGLGAASGYAYDQVMTPSYDVDRARNPTRGNVTKDRGITDATYQFKVKDPEDIAFFQKMYDSMSPEEQALYVASSLDQIQDQAAFDDGKLLPGFFWGSNEFTSTRFPDVSMAEVRPVLDFTNENGILRAESDGNLYPVFQFTPKGSEHVVYMPDPRKTLWTHPDNRR